MKVIDLLNKIANDELEDLALVKFCEHDCLTIYHKADNRFEFANKGDWEDYFYKIDIEELNDEVEIIEENKDIEELNLMFPICDDIKNAELGGFASIYKSNLTNIKYKIDEIIDEVNKLKGKYE